MPSPNAPPPRRASTRRRRVLAVDDDHGFLEMLTSLLLGEDLDLRTALGGHAGLLEAAAWDPDLILLDLGMTDLDGAAFLERYRGATPAPAPVVLLTGAIDGRSRATELGVASYLAKPFELGELVELLDAHITHDGDIAPA